MNTDKTGRILNTGDYAAQVDPSIASQLEQGKIRLLDDPTKQVLETKKLIPIPVEDLYRNTSYKTSNEIHNDGLNDVIMEVKLDDINLGSINISELTIGHQLELENCKDAKDIVNWLVKYANGDRNHIIQSLSPLPIVRIIDLLQILTTGIGKGIALISQKQSR